MKRWKHAFLAAAGVSLGIGMVPLSALAATTTVTVKPGDSLWKIAQSHHVSVQSLEASNPGINPSDLLVGTSLKLPQSQTQTTYRVQKGDSLFLVARKFGITLTALQSANPSVSATNLQVGTVLRIPSTTAAATYSATNGAMQASGTMHTAGTASSTDIYWMSRIIYAEAGNQSLNAQIGVGDVVWHRVMSSKYPNTVKGVIFQQVNGYYQFTPVANGSIYNTPSAQSIQAAREVLLQHIDVVPGAYVFYTPSKTPANSWVRRQPYVTTYDTMVFSV